MLWHVVSYRTWRRGNPKDDIAAQIVWPTTAAMVGLTPPPHGEWVGNDGKPIYFDGIDAEPATNKWKS